MAEMISPAAKARRRRRHRRRITIAAVTVAVLVAIGGGIAFASGGTKSASYRTAVAAMGSVDQTTTSAGTVSYVKKATAAFPVAGTVAAVGVKVGDTVKAGQVVARLDPADLTADLATAVQTLTDDKQTLADDLASQTAQAAAAAVTATATTTAPTTQAAAAAADTSSSSGSSASGLGSSGSGSSGSGSGSSGSGSRSTGSGSSGSGSSGSDSSGSGSSGSANKAGGSTGSKSGSSQSAATTAAPTIGGSAAGGNTGRTGASSSPTATAALVAAVQAAQKKVVAGQADIDHLLTGVTDVSTGSFKNPAPGGTGTGKARGRAGSTTSTPNPTTGSTTTQGGQTATKSQAALIADEVKACAPISTMKFPPAPETGRSSSMPTSTKPAFPTRSGAPKSVAPSTAVSRPKWAAGASAGHTAPAAFVVVTPSVKAAVEDVVVGKGDAIVAADAAYRAIGADITDPTTGTTTQTQTVTETTTATVTPPTVTETTTVTPSTVTQTETTTVQPTATGTTTTVTVPTTVHDTSASPSPTPVNAPPTGTAPAQALLNCQNAIKLVLDNQELVAAAEKQQSTDLVALDTAVSKLAAAGASGRSTTSSGTGRSTGTTQSGSAGNSGTNGGTGTRTGTGTGTSYGSGSSQSASPAAAAKTPGSAGSGSGSGSSTTTGAAAKTTGTGSTRTGTNTGAGSSSTGAGAGNSAGSGGSGGSGGSFSGQGQTSKVITAADIAADQAQIDLDQANITVAQQNVTEAVLTSPINGTVAAVAITPGNKVSANSTTSTITVLGPGQYQVATSISLSLIDQLKVADKAAVTVNGITTALTGKVTTIGVLSSSSTSGNTTYPVTVALDPTSQTLYQGSGASAVITLSDVDNVLTVPTSAVKTSGTQHTVSVLDNGSPTTVVVEVGAVGTDLTQITSGIKAGQQVVIADLNQPIATTTAATAGRGLGGLGASGAGARGAGGAGGFTGAGSGAGGFVRAGG